VLGPRGGRLDEREHLDLVELVDAEDAPGVLAGGARLAAKAGGYPAAAAREVVGGEDLAGPERGDRNLRGADEEELVALDLVDHLALRGEEAGPEQSRFAHQDRGDDRDEALGPGPLHGEPDQSELDEDEVAEQVGEPRPRGGRGLVHLDPAVV